MPNTIDNTIITGTNGTLDNGKTSNGAIPNIYGEFVIAKAGYYGNGSGGQDCFTVRNEGQGNGAPIENNGGTIVSFSADRCSSVYTNVYNNAVYPKCIFIAHLIKY